MSIYSDPGFDSELPPTDSGAESVEGSQTVTRFLHAGDRFSQEHRFGEAAEQYQKALKACTVRLAREPDNTKLLLAQALSHTGLEQYTDAERILRRILVSKPDDHEARVELARVLARQGRYEEAIELLKTARDESAAADCPTLVGLGVLYAQLGDTEQALKVLRDAEVLHPEAVEPKLEIARVLEESGDIPGALSQYRRVLSFCPDDSEVRYEYATLLQDEGELEPAETELQRLCSEHPQEARFHASLGEVLTDCGSHDRALVCFRKASQLQPERADYVCEQGWLQQQCGRPRCAEQAYRQALILRPDYAPAHNGLGMLYQEKGLLDAALDEYARAIALEPDSDWPIFNLGLLYCDRGELVRAEECFRQVLELDCTDAEAHCMLGHVLRQLGRYQEALQAYQRAEQCDPERPEPQGALCLFYADSLGDYENALAAGQAFVQRGGTDPEVTEVIRRLCQGFDPSTGSQG